MISVKYTFIYFLLVQWLVFGISSADFEEERDNSPSNDGDKSDIYDPVVLEQEVENEERRNKVVYGSTELQLNMQSFTDLPMKGGHNLSSNHIVTHDEEEHHNLSSFSQDYPYSKDFSNVMSSAKSLTNSKQHSSADRTSTTFTSTSKKGFLSEEYSDFTEYNSDGSESDSFEVSRINNHSEKTKDWRLEKNGERNTPIAMKLYFQHDLEGKPNDQSNEIHNKFKDQISQSNQGREPSLQTFKTEANFVENSFGFDNGKSIVEPLLANKSDFFTEAPQMQATTVMQGNAKVPYTNITKENSENSWSRTEISATSFPLNLSTEAHVPTSGYQSTTIFPDLLITTTATSRATIPPLFEDTTRTIVSGKQGKNIHISRRKLLPHEQLRDYIEDTYIRMPLAVIIDPSSESLERTKKLWHDALEKNFDIKIVLISLNGSGIPAAYNFNNTRQFLAGLNSIKENTGGDAFIGIVHASELVPYDSAVFISTATIPPHTELVQDAAITLLKKRIRLYLIWYGEKTASENETQESVGGILGEVSVRSGGDILHIVGSENSQELEQSSLTLITGAFRGPQEIKIPVDTTLSGMHLKIDVPLRMATLETPNGDINLKKLVKFKSRILSQNLDDQRLDAYVPLTKLLRSSLFRLKLIPESLEHEYTVFVRADRKIDRFLDDVIKRFETYFLEGTSHYPTKFRNSRLQSISSALAVASIQSHSNLKFPNNANEEQSTNHSPKSEIETFSPSAFNTKPKINATIAEDAKVTTGIQRNINVFQQGETKIEMGIESQILVAPGMMAQLKFDITNTRSDAIFHNIQVVDERSFLLRLSPQSIFLRSGEMDTVSVTLMVPSQTPQGTVDKITFTCHGTSTASLSLNLKVITTQDVQDTTAPSISWSFGNRCDNVASTVSNCAEQFWTMDITAQDWGTGIMRLQSLPSNIIYRSSYVVGSADPVKASYIATCCDPKVTLTAYDIAGNQKSYSVDVRDVVLSEASIAAIILGSLLGIILIILIVVGIIWCCRRRRVTLDLPTYRSHSSRSID